MKNKYKTIDDYVIIYMQRRNGDKYETVIDLDDLPKLLELNCTWYAHYYQSPKKWYACATINSKTIMLHRLLMGVTDRKIRVDHEDYNTLCNRKSNLRIANATLNARNRSKINCNNQSGHRNVCFYGNEFIVQLQINGKNEVILRTKSYEEACKIADDFRIKYYGEYAGMAE
jgi:hypothetical protein